MSKQDQSFHDYVMQDLLANIRGITSKAMFGGWGIYKDGVIFAIIVDGELYFKVDGHNRAGFEAHGSRPFVYRSPGKSKPVTMPYWLLPAEIMEDEIELRCWVDDAITVSKASKIKKIDKC